MRRNRALASIAGRLAPGLLALTLACVAALAATPASLTGQPSERLLVMVRMAPAHFAPAQGYDGAYDRSPARLAARRLAGALAKANGLTVLEDWPMPVLGLDCVVMRPPPGQSASAAAAAIHGVPGVAWAQAVGHFEGRGRRGSNLPAHPFSRAPPLAARPNDPLFPLQPAARDWRLADLRQLADGRGVTVAVVDSGVDLAQPDLAGRVAEARDFVGGGGPNQPPARGEFHGTAVAGVIGARENNGAGIAGVAPAARLIALRACRQEGAGTRTNCDGLAIARALEFALGRRAEVINLSFAGPGDRLVGALLDIAVARRVSVIAAADPGLPSGGFPASHPGVIAAAPEGVSFAPAVDFPGAPRLYRAPGRDVPTTLPGGRWSLVDGSSFAAAHLAGLFALLRQRRASAWNGAALVLRQDGGVDACASLLRAAGPCDCACAGPPAAPERLAD